MIVSIIDELTHYLSGFEQEGGENWREENERYLAAHSRRFHETLKLLPPGKGGKKLLDLELRHIS